MTETVGARNRSMDSQDSIKGMLNRKDRSGALCKAWGHVLSNQIFGDYLEFGVYRGTTLIESFRILQEFKKEHRENINSPEKWRREISQRITAYEPSFHGMDTFAGMPKNDEGNVAYAEGTYAGDLDLVKARSEEVGLREPQLKLYKGLFRDTAKSVSENVSKAAIVNIDGDLYESAVDTLKIVEPVITQGTVLLFDDYNAFAADNRAGERKAFREFQEGFAGRFEPWFDYMILGQSFLCVQI